MIQEKGENLPKFLIDKGNISGNRGKICGGDAAHIVRVLRLGAGDAVTVCDGEGTDYEAEIVKADSDCVQIQIRRSYFCETEPKIAVTLFQGLPKAAKMEYIIQKCTELGIAEIVPVTTRRTVVKIEDAKAEKKKLDRWNKIAFEAVKQCGRGKVPKVLPVADICDICREISHFDLIILANEAEREQSLRGVLRSFSDVSKVGIIIGPEGGFDPDEVTQMQSCGAVSVTLGKRILRTETAGHTVLTAVLYEFGELE